MELKKIIIFVPTAVFVLTLIWSACNISFRVHDNLDEIKELQKKIEVLEEKNSKLEEMYYRTMIRDTLKKK